MTPITEPQYGVNRFVRTGGPRTISCQWQGLGRVRELEAHVGLLTPHPTAPDSVYQCKIARPTEECQAAKHSRGSCRGQAPVDN